MLCEKDFLSFMDLLDLDEEIIDTRLRMIMNRERFLNKHLVSAIQLLRYKHLVNLQEEIECDNDKESEFVAKLLKEIDEDNIDLICEIVVIVLGLNTTTLVNRSEHFLQQMLLNIDIPTSNISDVSDETLSHKYALLVLKAIDSILQAVIDSRQKLLLPFLEVPLKNILICHNEKLKTFFLCKTVPKLFESVSGYHILDAIWDCIKDFTDRETTLKVLSSLSNYYLPAKDENKHVVLESNIVYYYDFWNTILYGLLSNDLSLRKISSYLAKRALDNVTIMKKDICVKFKEKKIFEWITNESSNYRSMWDNFFILMDSLEEKQSNIVMPSLQLFCSLKNIGIWLSCAFNIGLQHDNTEVRFKCIQHRFDTKLSSQSEAVILLETLNDINIYESPYDFEELKRKFLIYFNDSHVFTYILTSIPLIKWSPVPFYHLSTILANENLKITNQGVIAQTVCDILKISCNIIPLRIAIHLNISNFVGTCCSELEWRQIVNIYSSLQVDGDQSCGIDNQFITYISKNFNLSETEKIEFLKFVTDTYKHLDFAVMYLKSHEQDLSVFNEILTEKHQKLNDIITRHYSDKTECLYDVIYLLQLFNKTYNKNDSCSTEAVNKVIAAQYKNILLYIMNLLTNNVTLTIDELHLVFDGLSFISNSIKDDNVNDDSTLYKMSVLFINDKDTLLESKILALYIIHSLSSNLFLQTYYKHEMIKIQDILKVVKSFNYKQSLGLTRNMFYEKSCEIMEKLIAENVEDTEQYLEELTEFIVKNIDCGGFGCLRLCLKMIIRILPLILTRKSMDDQINMGAFISRAWTETEELKSNNQHTPCLREFINLILHDNLIEIPLYNNVIISHCKKIIDYGALKGTPLYYLVEQLNSKVLTENHGHLIYVLSEILLYSPVPRKNQRIAENLITEVYQSQEYGFHRDMIDIYFNYQIQLSSVVGLSKINNPDILKSIQTIITSRVNEAFRNKIRYHGHSQPHRLLLTALQHLLLISLMKTTCSKDLLFWSTDLLRRIPHQPSVRICLEWYIALHFYKERAIINKETLFYIKNIPLASQFMVLYWLAKRKLSTGICLDGEYEFVMDFLLSHTTGQMFNLRLLSQYLATNLYEINKTAPSKYDYTINVIKNTFKDNETDRNFSKLQSDYFANSFDIVNDLTPSFLYYFLLRYCEINNNERVDLEYVKDVLGNINNNIINNLSDSDFHKEWFLARKNDDSVFALDLWKNEGRKTNDDEKAVGTIQKKYIPWKHMSDINIYEGEIKKSSNSDLIVVASLIDKLPNLGGLARTSEVFGVKTYVVDSLRHLNDRQFQGLSVSAERWIDVKEVRPGECLKEYLMQMKAEGYSVVAAEQTSTSQKLQTFKFPKKTLLLLGHEKDGVPCDLLPLMDHCVEIPQQGYVRSLNVHVTAAIFVWEYARQNILQQ